MSWCFGGLIGLPAPSEKWEVIFHDEFLPEFRALDLDVRRELAAAAKAIELAGLKTGRPHVDTLNGSKHDNMKQLRFKAHNGSKIWRAGGRLSPSIRSERPMCWWLATSRGRTRPRFTRP